MPDSEFIEQPNTVGFSTKKIRLIVVLVIIIGIILVLIVFKQLMSSNGPVDRNKAGAKQNAIPQKVANNDDTINKIVNATPSFVHLKIESVSDTDKLNNSVPPILDKVGKSITNNQDSLIANSMNDQLHQMAEQEKIQQKQKEYQAYSAGIDFGDASKKSSSNLAENNESVHATKVLNEEKSELSSSFQKRKSIYTLNAGTLIPCTMYSGLNSELSGTIISTVRENVYNTTSGQFLVIPQGSKLVGKYSNQVSYGSERIGVAWNRLIYPNGDSIDLKGLPGSDLAGYEGLSDIVDNHYWRLFGASFIIGVITAGMQYSQNSTNANVQSGGTGAASTNNNPTVGQTLSGSLGQQLGQTGLSITNKALNVSPTIIIRQGTMINVMLTSDLVLKPYVEEE